MSNLAITWSYSVKCKNATEQCILTALADYANQENFEAYPSLNSLAEMCSTTQRTVIRVISSLIEQGFIEKMSNNHPDGSCATNVYKLNVDLSVIEKEHKKRRERSKYYKKRTNIVSESSDTVTERFCHSVRSYDPSIDPISITNVIDNMSNLDAVNKKQMKKTNAKNIEIVFEHWKKITQHEHAKLDVKRKKKITDALTLGYSTDDLCQAIDGCCKTPWNMGGNPDGRIYDSLELILRDAEHIDRFITHDKKPPTKGNGNGYNRRRSGKCTSYDLYRLAIEGEEQARREREQQQRTYDNDSTSKTTDEFEETFLPEFNPNRSWY